MTRHFLTGAALLMAILLPALRADGADKQTIQQAIDRGVLHLRNLQAADGSWPAHPAGATALVGLTLLECDVPATDPAVQAAANYLHKAWSDINDHYTTYALSLTILFLDRLGDPADTPIIQALGARLLGGQNAAGAWSYACPQFGKEDLRRLRTLLDRQVELKTKSAKAEPAARNSGDRPALPREIKQLVSHMEQKGPPPGGRQNPTAGGGGDNSNTQFAILGLWAARRHGVPVEKALARAAARFGASQRADGGWSYMVVGRGPKFGGSTPAMTCAGLLGLALGFGSAREVILRTEPKLKSAKAASTPAPDLSKDLAIRAGLNYLAGVIGQRLEEGGPGGFGGGLGDMYYTLWSVERVGVAYGLPTIGNKDWYAWGSGLLLSAQQANGGWQGKFGTDIDTSFALLFLRRANLASDLTAFLKGAGFVEVALKAGEVPREKAAKVEGEKKGDVRPDKTAKDEGEKSSKPRIAEEAKVGRNEPATASADKGAKPGAGANAEAKSDPGVRANPTPSLPAAKNADAEAARLSAEFLKASGQQQEQLLDQFKQAKGAAYTEALAVVIRQSSGGVKTKARAALAERLAHMTAATLRNKLQDEAPEIRRAAALACAIKADKQFIPDLATLLEDKQMSVARAAQAALKDMTGQDLGPTADASPAARSQAAAAWKEWWKKQSGK